MLFADRNQASLTPVSYTCDCRLSIKLHWWPLTHRLAIEVLLQYTSAFRFSADGTALNDSSVDHRYSVKSAALYSTPRMQSMFVLLTSSVQVVIDV
jgi:hypothetical protein